MSEEQNDLQNQGTDLVKTCPHCRGTWAAARTHCLACGASLADVPARPPLEDPLAGRINWRVLDALSPDDSSPEEADEALPTQGKGRWWEFWR